MTNIDIAKNQQIKQAPFKKNFRYDYLDVLRGVAIAGILLVNIIPTTGIDFFTPTAAYTESGNLYFLTQHKNDLRIFLDLWVNHRFFPIFSLLFGISFALILEKSKAYTSYPQLVLFRRLLILGCLGALHNLLAPGEALFLYAIIGMIVLFPASFIPQKYTPLIVVTGLIFLALTFFVEILLLEIAGLFLLGMSIVRYNLLPQVSNAKVSHLWGLAVIALTAAMPFLYLQWQTLYTDQNMGAILTAGYLIAFSYILALCALMNTSSKKLLITIFRPLGRLALTNYLSATLIFVPVGHALRFNETKDWNAAFILTLLILIFQWIFSTRWLKKYPLGPCESVVRYITKAKFKNT